MMVSPPRAVFPPAPTAAEMVFLTLVALRISEAKAFPGVSFVGGMWVHSRSCHIVAMSRISWDFIIVECSGLPDLRSFYHVSFLRSLASPRIFR